MQSQFKHCDLNMGNNRSEKAVIFKVGVTDYSQTCFGNPDLQIALDKLKANVLVQRKSQGGA